jgi:hypothetical protein
MFLNGRKVNSIFSNGRGIFPVDTDPYGLGPMIVDFNG